MTAGQVRYQVALAIGAGRAFHFVQDSSATAELPDFWSLPIRSVSAEEFAAIQPGRQARVPGFSGIGTCVNITERLRADYRLAMALFSVETDPHGSRAPAEVVEHARHKVDDVLDIVRAAERRVELSVSMLLQHLMAIHAIPSPQDYLELGPQHLGVDLDQASDAQLWRLADFAHAFARTEGLERYGTLVKRATADAFIKGWIQRLAPRCVVDIGCGDGSLAREMAAFAERVIGVDHSVGEACKASNVQLLRGDFLTAPASPFSEADVAVLNLVIPWMESLDVLLAQLSALPGLRHVLVTFCPSEFSKNGYWIMDSDGQWCWLVRDAMGEDKVLTMIDARIGPVRLHRRQLPTIVSRFARHGFYVETMEYLNVERSADVENKTAIYSGFPDARRNAKVPQFVGILFERG